MRTTVKLNLKGQKSKIIAKIAARLRADGIVCLPSDTCYGFSCLATSNEATEKLRRIKKRDASRPFILIVNDTEIAIGYAKNWSAQTRLITDTFWPGPISVVVPFQQSKSCPIAHTGKTIAIRVPASDILREIMAKVNRPLWSTSANEPKSTCLTTPKCISSYILNSIDVVLDIGELTDPSPSTIIDLSIEKPIILREGPITAKDITSKTEISLDVFSTHC